VNDAHSQQGAQFERIIRTAGLAPWPTLFQNLRATCETELAEKFPSHVVCEWIGHSQTVAAKYCLQVTDDHFASAVAATEPVHYPMQPGADTTGQQMANAPAVRSILGKLETYAALLPIPVGDTGLEPVTSAV
jgi:hypothetical protein